METSYILLGGIIIDGLILMGLDLIRQRCIIRKHLLSSYLFQFLMMLDLGYQLKGKYCQQAIVEDNRQNCLIIDVQ